MVGKKHIALVEDNDFAFPNIIAKLEERFGKIVIHARSFEAFQKLLYPRKDEIAIWFLDVRILLSEDDTIDEANPGLKIAEMLHKHCPTVPRFCISGTDEWEQVKDWYSGKIDKRDINSMIAEAAKVL